MYKAPRISHDLFYPMARGYLVFCSLLAGCVPPSESLTKEVPVPALSFDDELGASDLSILVPLQSTIQTDLSRSIFGKSGTGMCNAPTLDLGGDDPVLSESLWQDWAKDTLLSTLPLPAETNLWTQSSDTFAVASRTSELSTQMAALPDVDSEDLCPDAVGIEDLKTDEVESLRNAGTHVAVTQTLPAGACRYKNWHIVAARFQICGFRPKVLSDDPEALSFADGKNFPAEECGGSELRLVLQPFIHRPDGGYGAIDMAIHAFYKLDDPVAFIDDLRSLRRVTRAKIGAVPAAEPLTVWQEDKKDMFLPHPGLREEMDCTTESASRTETEAVGPVGIEWRRVLAKYARQSQLFKLTWMTSDNSGANWSFGLRLVQPEAGTLAPRKVLRHEPLKVESFTLSQVAKGFPFTPFDLTTNSVDYFYREGRADRELTSEAGQAALKELLHIADPDKTSLNLGGKMGAACASCHFRDQTERSVTIRTGKTHEELARLANTKSWAFPLWPPVQKNIEKRNNNNLRNFGYGSAMNLGVSRRALNETEALRLLVKEFFNPGQTPILAETKAAVAMPANPDFERDIKPILSNRCGYCHNEKRAPALMKENTASIYAGAIVEDICSEGLAWQHMPPGKDLPSAEKRMILAWANSLNPSHAPLTCGTHP